MLDVVFSLNRNADVIVRLEIDEPLQAISFCEAGYLSSTVFADPADQIIGNADVQNPIRPIGQYVDPAALHADILQNVDGRDKPGHDGGARFGA
jgi:hypothetical protein